jgi:hypothetical protein
MGQFNKRQKHLRKLREAQRQRLEERIQETLEIMFPELHEAHLEGLSDCGSESDVEISEPEDNIPVGDTDAFKSLIRTHDERRFLYPRDLCFLIVNSTAILLPNDTLQMPLEPIAKSVLFFTPGFGTEVSGKWATGSTTPGGN